MNENVGVAISQGEALSHCLLDVARVHMRLAAGNPCSLQMGGVEVEQAWVPEQWPERSFDLIVISELAYFLPVDALDPRADRILASLEPDGVVLGCHRRRPIEGCALSGDQVQARLGARPALPQLTRIVDADLRPDVWCRDPRAVAQREGFA